eukprot:TRINITY_DN100693_c0_g1_i1.p1 TRINITY_DN100693_c0_g1~~TRINITY_DN100693_c0_g1_i1.p1  ORF type:complete len:832 (+),score=170.59 TRINITY_DN100693_c0_g1_i1:101-2596(+)
MVRQQAAHPAAAKPKGEASSTLVTARGRALPHGCSETREGANFSLTAPDATSAWLLIEAAETVGLDRPEASWKSIQLDSRRHRSGATWHAELRGTQLAGRRYAWLLDPVLGNDGKPDLEAAKTKPLLDPHAHVLDSASAAKWNCRASSRYSPMAVVPDFQALSDFDWQGVESPGYEMKDLVIYEASVRGYTRHPDSEVSNWEQNAGTFLGFVEKIPHLQRLGVNCVELLPIFEFDETACPRKHPENGQDLCNYWGYQTVAYNVPMQRFAAKVGTGQGGSERFCASIVEFKTLVRELHRHGIEIILDVVFNHTGEGAWGENNWHSLSEVAKSHYYLLSNGYHTNYTGCGNTLNANDPLCAEWIVDCLRYWAVEMQVDGFRFDLAAALTRGPDGQIQSDPLLIKRIATDPCLQSVKLIAEPWDCSWQDGYLVGTFPQGSEEPRWAEWNGKFRDVVRRFIKGDAGLKGQFATRICGSADLYQEGGRAPYHSINFVTAHDGFTLRDLVSYNAKQNAANGESSGEDENLSWNCSVDGGRFDGPSDDPKVLALRERQMRNMMCALFLSSGTPMMLAGDEYGRSQEGNNNTWCQDSLNWFSWKDCQAEEDGLLRFCQLVISIRRSHSRLFAREEFASEQDIMWNHEDWDNQYNYLSFILTSSWEEPSSDEAESSMGSTTCPTPGDVTDCSAASVVSPTEGGGTTFSAAQPQCQEILVAFNAGHLVHGCHLPAGRRWVRLVDTSLEAPLDIADCDEDAQPITGDNYDMTPYSCIVLKSCQAGAGITYRNLDLDCELERHAVRKALKQVVHRTVAEELESFETSGLPLSGCGNGDTLLGA